MSILRLQSTLQNTLIVFLSTTLLMLSACVTNTIGSADIEKHLQSLIGRKYDPLIGWGHGWQKTFENEQHIEFEQKLNSGCSFSIQIRKDLSVVESWKITSPKEKCDNLPAPTV